MQPSLNRIQQLVLGFFAFVWLALVAILLIAPDVYTQALSQMNGALFLLALTLLIAVLVAGTWRRWRWTFWLVFIAFLFGLLRVPAAALELAGVIPAGGPGWYEVLQGVIGAVQFAIAVAMIAGYRKGGVWADF